VLFTTNSNVVNLGAGTLRVNAASTRLATGVEITANGGIIFGGSVESDVSPGQSLKLNANSGSIGFGGSIGGPNHPLGNLTLNAGTVSNRSANPLMISAGTLDINYSGGAYIDSGGKDIIFKLDRLTHSAAGHTINAGAAGSVTLAPFTPGRSVEYGDEEKSSPQKDIFYQSLWKGFTAPSFTVGDGDTGDITVSDTGNAGAFGGNGVPYPLVLQNGNDHSIILTGDYKSNGKLLTLQNDPNSSAAKTGTAGIDFSSATSINILLGGGTSGAFKVDKSARLSGAAAGTVNITALGGITFGGALDSDANSHSIVMSAGAAGNIVIGGSVGGGNKLGGITVAADTYGSASASGGSLGGANVSFGGTVNSSGSFRVLHSGVLDLADDVTADDGFYQNDKVSGGTLRIGRLSGGSSASGDTDVIEITTKSSGSIIFGSDIIIFFNLTLKETAAGTISTKNVYANYTLNNSTAWNFTAESGDGSDYGSVTINGVIGSAGQFYSLTMERLGNVSLSGGNVATSNIYTMQRGAVDGSVSITSNGGTWTLNGASALIDAGIDTGGGTAANDTGIVHSGGFITLNGNGTLAVRGGSISLQGAVNGGNTRALVLNGAGTITTGSISASTLSINDNSGVLSGTPTLFTNTGDSYINAHVGINTSVVLGASIKQAVGKVVTLKADSLDLDSYDWKMEGGTQTRRGFQGGILYANGNAGSLISSGDVVISGGNISKLSIVMTGGGTLTNHTKINIHSGQGGTFTNFVMTGTYAGTNGTPDTTAWVEAESDLMLSGSWLIPSWTTARSISLPDIADRQSDEQRFFPGTYTVTLTGPAMVISGNTFWYKLGYQIGGGTILFSNYPDIHTLLPGGVMSLLGGGSLTSPVVLDRLDNSSVWSPSGGTRDAAIRPDWPEVVNAAKDYFWVLSRHGTVFVKYLYTKNNFAWPESVFVNTAYVKATWGTESTVNWEAQGKFRYSFTEDTDGNGKLDRLRVQAPYELMWKGDPSDAGSFAVNLPIDTNKGFNKSGYAIDIIDSAAGENYLYIYLKESDEPDTGNRLTGWEITENENTLMTYDSEGNLVVISVDDTMPKVDTAPPRIYYTLAITGEKQIYIRFSELVEARKMQALAGNYFDTLNKYKIVDVKLLAPKSINTGGYDGPLDYTSQYLLTLDKALDVNDLMNGIVCNGALLREIRDVPPVPYTWPEPGTGIAYPNDYSYTSFSGVNGYFPDALESISGGNVSQPNFFMMGTASTRADSDAAKHRASDLLIMVRPGNADDEHLSLWPLYVRDTAGVQDVKQGVARLYDGSEKIRNTDLTVESIVSTSLAAGSLTTLNPEIAFTINKDFDKLWLPPAPNEKDAPGLSYLNVPHEKVVSSDVKKGGVAKLIGRNYFSTIRRDDILEAGMLDFLFSIPSPLWSSELGPLYGVRFKDTAPLSGEWYKPENFTGFRVNTGETKYQRSGATILSNVINPTKGEKTVLHYILTRGGQVTIQVFTLDGNLVQSLYRGSREAGEYDAVWDGKNRGGNIVARGMYFIRIVAPDIDEIRKVMVVK
jgi:hypothetical protein